MTSMTLHRIDCFNEILNIHHVSIRVSDLGNTILYVKNSVQNYCIYVHHDCPNVYRLTIGFCCPIRIFYDVIVSIGKLSP